MLYLAKQFLNDAYEEIWSAARWSFLKSQLEMATTASISTGTASVTLASQDVTLSTTLGASNYQRVVGRFFVVGGVPYKITSASSGTAIKLEKPYRGATNATASYNIYHVDYILPWEVNSILSVRDFTNGVALDTGGGDQLGISASITAGQPYEYYFLGHTWEEGYNTGSLSGTVGQTSNTGTLTGSGTAWSADGRVEVGDTILVYGLSGGTSGTTNIYAYPYTITVITDATTITVKPGLRETYAAGTLYEIKPRFSPMIRFFDWPNTVIPYQVVYSKRLPPLVADWDMPGIPPHLISLVERGATWRYHDHFGQIEQARMLEKDYRFRLSEAVLRDEDAQQGQTVPTVKQEY